MSKTTSQKAVTYLRVSTARQGESGLGLEAQREAVSKYLAGANLEVGTEFVEVESGRRKTRPQLKAALAEAKKRKAVLVVAKLDRLARNARFLLFILDSGVDVVFCDMPEIPAGAVGRFMLTQMAAVAELEAGLISERTKAALAVAKTRGVKIGANGKNLAKANKAEADKFAGKLAPVIEEIRETGITTGRGIAAELNKREIPTARGGRWHLLTVQRLLDRIAA